MLMLWFVIGCRSRYSDAEGAVKLLTCAVTFFSLLDKNFYSCIYTTQEMHFKAIMPSTELFVIMKCINQQF